MFLRRIMIDSVARFNDEVISKRGCQMIPVIKTRCINCLHALSQRKCGTFFSVSCLVERVAVSSCEKKVQVRFHCFPGRRSAVAEKNWPHVSPVSRSLLGVPGSSTPLRQWTFEKQDAKDEETWRSLEHLRAHSRKSKCVSRGRIRAVGICNGRKLTGLVCHSTLRDWNFFGILIFSEKSFLGEKNGIFLFNKYFLDIMFS